MRRQISGQGWARFALGFGAVLSIVGNVANTWLADSAIGLGLRIPFAIVWPAGLFVAVEVLVRVPWRNRLIDWLGRIVLLLPVSAVAAIVSYRHLHHLMTLAGEDAVSSVIGPLAIDGLMMGGTVALLAIRAISMVREPEPVDVDAITEKWNVSTDVDARAVPEQSESPAAPVRELDAGTVLVHGETERSGAVEIGAAPERKPRAGSEGLSKAVSMLIERREVPDVVAATEVGLSTVRLYAKVVRLLRDNPQMEIGQKLDGRSVRPELVAIIRDAMNRERAL